MENSISDITKKHATDSLTAIISSLTEFNAANIRPNTVILSKEIFENLKLYFPYLFTGNSFIYNRIYYNILLTESSTVGTALFFSEELINLEKKI